MRNDIINAFYKNIFPYKDSESKTKEEKLGENSEEELKESINSIFTFIDEKSKEINNDLQKMSKEKIENKKPNEMLETVNEIIDFNKEIKKQRSSILTPDQMLSKLPITLAQLNSGNNSEKLKNELRQLLYSVQTKKLTKNIYRSLVDIIQKWKQSL